MTKENRVTRGVMIDLLVVVVEGLADYATTRLRCVQGAEAPRERADVRKSIDITGYQR